MVEPSDANPDRSVRVFGSLDRASWECVLSWRKDAWPSPLFQNGNASFPDGTNSSGVLAVSTIAVREADIVTTLWHVEPRPATSPRA
jgi:hypothetical protein